MAEFQEIDVNRIVGTDRVIIVKINYRKDFFDQIFGKLEMINAMEYLTESIQKHNIPEVFVRTRDGTNFPEFNEYSRIKMDRRKNRMAPKSILDQDLYKDFASYLPSGKMEIESSSGDLFQCKAFLDFLAKLKRKTVMLTGFFTELEVMRTAQSSLEHGFHGVTISDATSTYSERIYYEALDLISQSTEVIDTRDLMKIWP